MSTVLNISSNRWNSAITEYALSTARSLGDQGCKVTSIGLTGTPFLARLSRCELTFDEMPSFHLTQVVRLRQLFHKVKPDVIITHGGPETVLAALGTGSAVPLVRVRGYDFAGGGVLSGLTHDMSQLGVRAIVTPSEYVSQKLRLASKLPIHSITLGIDTKKFMMRKLPQILRPEVLIFGRFDPVKGHKEFMQIFKEMLPMWDQSVAKPLLKIVGLPANLSKTHLEAFAVDAGLQLGEEVEITAAKVDDVAELMQSASLGVISSISSEIICRVAEEFLSVGTPIFVSGVGSLEETLMDKTMGDSYKNLTTHDAAVTLKERLQQSFKESGEQKHIRSQKAREAFSLRRMGKAWLDVIHNLKR